jgi:hypothetical protein
MGYQEGVRTAVKDLELVARQLGSVHALQERTDAGIVLAPEVVGDWTQSVVSGCVCLGVRPERGGVAVRTRVGHGRPFHGRGRHRAFDARVSCDNDG